ncbi:hypothetical protein GCM10010978_09900 [Compostibacillus humi]|uniref:Uncharacterized protein n=1 Tax=Compostibacillus humi TaxID=1245525 RepID=A0A8J2ZQB4_9BACI|nr:hypothetical protein [Compostibacillus humi]GGH72718.1 hypothetical protein GCM10010978_09900 [Compostibacillus humi]
MRLPKLKGVKVIDKGDKPRYQDSDVWEKSSDIVVYNLYEQDWCDLKAEGLTHIFDDDKAEFDRRKVAFYGGKGKLAKKYKAYAITWGNEVGLGIEEYDGDETLSIASIYLNPRPSNKELFDIAARHVIEGLESGEYTLLRVTNPIRAKYQWIQRYNGQIFVKREPSAHMPFIQARLLAQDALQRKTTIIEKFGGGLTYKHKLPGKGGE